jgi:glyoxylase I family protein
MIVGIHHIAIGVDNIDKAIEFYTQALGFELADEATLKDNPLVDKAIGLPGVNARMAMLKAPNAFIELWQYTQPQPEDLRSRPCDLGYPHFALQVRDIQSEYDRLAAAGMTFVGEVVKFGDAAAAIYGRDPFGNVIELYEIHDPDTPQLSST